MPDVITDIQSVYLPGDDRYLEDTRSTVKYPSLIIRDPAIDVQSTEGQRWMCEVIICDVAGKKWSDEDSAMERVYGIATTLIWLLAKPQLLGFGYGVEVMSQRMEQVSISGDKAMGWLIKFSMMDHDRMCDPDSEAIPSMPSVSLSGTYASDEEALADGRQPGQWYLLSEDNIYGVTTANIPKKIDS